MRLKDFGVPIRVGKGRVAEYSATAEWRAMTRREGRVRSGDNTLCPVAKL
jgi:hypothetical protein